MGPHPLHLRFIVFTYWTLQFGQDVTNYIILKFMTSQSFDEVLYRSQVLHYLFHLVYSPLNELCFCIDQMSPNSMSVILLGLIGLFAFIEMFIQSVPSF